MPEPTPANIPSSSSIALGWVLFPIIILIAFLVCVVLSEGYPSFRRPIGAFLGILGILETLASVGGLLVNIYPLARATEDKLEVKK